jgi:hypothetical protein
MQADDGPSLSNSIEPSRYQTSRIEIACSQLRDAFTGNGFVANERVPDANRQFKYRARGPIPHECNMSPPPSTEAIECLVSNSAESQMLRALFAMRMDLICRKATLDAEAN